MHFKSIRGSFLNKIFSSFLIIIFLSSFIISPQYAAAQSLASLPAPGSFVGLSDAYMPAMMTGVNIDPQNPLKFNFVIDKGFSGLEGDAFKTEAGKLVKYFLAALTVPESEMWVNLSPYEKDRIVPKAFGQTAMGRELLAQDYLLKQLTSSLLYPEDELGKEFWQRVRAKAWEQFGTTEVPMDTFNKIWIIPETARVYEHERGAYVMESHLKVMLEEDYVAMREAHGESKTAVSNQESTRIQTEILKDVLIPEIEREVNQGQNFVELRQIYNTVILASWYKSALKDSLIGQGYADQHKTGGLETSDPEAIQTIYNQYVQAFKQGVYSLVKDEYDANEQKVLSRKYFSGGVGLEETNAAMTVTHGDQNSFQEIFPTRVTVELAVPKFIVGLDATNDGKRVVQFQGGKSLVATYDLGTNKTTIRFSEPGQSVVSSAVAGNQLGAEWETLLKIVTGMKKVDTDAAQLTEKNENEVVEFQFDISDKIAAEYLMDKEKRALLVEGLNRLLESFIWKVAFNMDDPISVREFLESDLTAVDIFDFVFILKSEAKFSLNNLWNHKLHAADFHGNVKPNQVREAVNQWLDAFAIMAEVVDSDGSDSSPVIDLAQLVEISDKHQDGKRVVFFEKGERLIVTYNPDADATTIKFYEAINPRTLSFTVKGYRLDSSWKELVSIVESQKDIEVTADSAQLDGLQSNLQPTLQKLVASLGFYDVLEQLLKIYKDAVDTSSEGLKEETEKQINMLVDKTNEFNSVPVDQLEVLTDVLLLDDFVVAGDYARYLERAQTLVLRGKYVPQFIFAGAATRLGRGAMYPLDIWEIADEMDLKADNLETNTYGMGPRQILVYRIALEKLAQELNMDADEVLKNQTIVVNTNGDIHDDVISDFKENDFYGFNPQNVYFVKQPVLQGYSLVEGKVVLDETSKALPYGHGYNIMQMREGNQATQYIDGQEVIVSDSVLSKLDDDSVIGTHRINDLTRFTTQGVLDLDKLAYGMYLHDQGHNIVGELVANPGGQKGGNTVRDVKTGKSFLLETSNTKASAGLTAKIDKAGEAGAPYNAFRLLYQVGELKKLIQTDLPYNLRSKNGNLYLEAVTGDITQLPDADAVFFRQEGELIHDFKQQKNVPDAVDFLTQSDKDINEWQANSTDQAMSVTSAVRDVVSRLSNLVQSVTPEKMETTIQTLIESKLKEESQLPNWQVEVKPLGNRRSTFTIVFSFKGEAEAGGVQKAFLQTFIEVEVAPSVQQLLPGVKVNVDEAFGYQDVVGDLVKTTLSVRVSSDKAVLTETKNDVGGIDLNPTMMNMDVERNGNGVIIPAFTPEMLKSLQNVDGLVPLIIDVTPISNLPLWLGMADEAEDSPAQKAGMDAPQNQYFENIKS